MRRYQHIQELLPKIKELQEQGKSQREIADILGLEGERPIHELLKRERRKERQGKTGSKGRKPAVKLAEYKRKCVRLEMENRLLRDFLQYTERE